MGRERIVDTLWLGKVEATLDNLASAITAPFLVPYAVALGASDWQVGLITAVPLLAANVSQVPGARWAARSGHPRLYLLLAGPVECAAWLVLALLLLARRVDFTALFLLVVAARVSSGLLTPLWTAFLGEQVPEGQRGSYFGSRNFLGGLGGMAGAFLSASLVSLVGFGPGNGLALATAALATAGALAAMVAALEPGSRQHPIEVSDLDRPPSQDWRSPAVRSYIVYGALLILGAGMATPFYPVHFISRLGGAPEVATTAIAVAGALVMLAQGLFGRIVDRVGFRMVGSVSLAAIASVPVLWLAAREPAHGVPIWLFNGLMWAGCGIATLSLMLAISNDANRALVVGWVNALQAPVNFAAPLIGGLVAERAGTPVLFVLASATLAASWLYFLRSFSRSPG